MKKLLIIIFLSTPLMSQYIEAQNAFKVTRSTFGNGGGYCSNETYQLNGTLSQSFIGHTQNDTHQGGIGFWYRSKDRMTTSSSTLEDQERSDFHLLQNEPNPFHQVTVIGFTLPVASFVRLTIVDAFGREMEEVIDRRLAAGDHSVHFDGEALKSGVYFYHLQTGQFSQSRQMILIK